MAEGENEVLKLSPPHAELPPSFGEQFSEQYGMWVVLAAVFLLVLVGVAVWWMLRPKPPVAEPIEILTRKDLELLREQTEDGQLLSRVSRILRRYVAGAFDLPPEELTTSEFCRAVAANESIGPELAARLGEFLRRCDELKFAPTSSPTPMVAAVRALELVALSEARRAHLRTLEAEAAARLNPRT